MLQDLSNTYRVYTANGILTSVYCSFKRSNDGNYENGFLYDEGYDGYDSTWPSGVCMYNMAELLLVE